MPDGAGSLTIVQLEPLHRTRGGDWYYRTHAPGRALAGRDGIHVVDATNAHRALADLVEGADVLVLNMVTDLELVPVIDARKAQGRPTVYELNDDVAYIQPWNSVAKFYENQENQALLRRLLQRADAVQYSTSELEARYGHLNERGMVLPNQLSSLPGVRPARGQEATVTVGWGGSHGHLQDMARVAPALAGWLGQRAHVRFSVMGSAPIAALFNGVSPAQLRVVSPGSLEEYYEFLSTLDIGIAPLADTGFNRCRSDVKFLEYAAHGVVPVLERRAPYAESVRAGETGLFFEDAASLLGALDELVADRARLANMARAARAYVERERLEVDHVDRRLDFYRALVTERGAGRSVGQSAVKSALFERCAALEGAKVEGRHVALEETSYERLLHDGLVLASRPGERERARELLLRAGALPGATHHPFLFAASVADAPLEDLKRALERNSKSPTAWLRSAEAFAQSGDVGASLNGLRCAAELCPGYELPYLRMSKLLLHCGLERESEELAQLAHELARATAPARATNATDA